MLLGMVIMNKISDVVNYRKKIFNNNKFEKYVNVLDEMQIPEKFDFQNCIPEVFGNINYKKSICKFKIKPYKDLYKATNSYIKDYKIDNKKTNLLVVHPFYPLIRHANFLIENSNYFEEYKKYENRMLKIFDDLNYNIILLESPDNFARYTYKFYDKNKFIKVIFTEHSTGKILKNEDLKYLKQLNNFEIVGCYGEYCIRDIEKQLKDKKIKRNKEIIMERAKKI